MEWYTEDGKPKLKTTTSQLEDFIGTVLVFTHAAFWIIIFLAAFKYLFG